jgi:hypothetical protein
MRCVLFPPYPYAGTSSREMQAGRQCPMQTYG